MIKKFIKNMFLSAVLLSTCIITNTSHTAGHKTSVGTNLSASLNSVSLNFTTTFTSKWFDADFTLGCGYRYSKPNSYYMHSKEVEEKMDNTKTILSILNDTDKKAYLSYEDVRSGENLNKIEGAKFIISKYDDIKSLNSKIAGNKDIWKKINNTAEIKIAEDNSGYLLSFTGQTEAEKEFKEKHLANNTYAQKYLDDLKLNTWKFTPKLRQDGAVAAAPASPDIELRFAGLQNVAAFNGFKLHKIFNAEGTGAATYESTLDPNDPSTYEYSLIKTHSGVALAAAAANPHGAKTTITVVAAAGGAAGYQPIILAGPVAANTTFVGADAAAQITYLKNHASLSNLLSTPVTKLETTRGTGAAAAHPNVEFSYSSNKLLSMLYRFGDTPTQHKGMINKLFTINQNNQHYVLNDKAHFNKGDLENNKLLVYSNQLKDASTYNQDKVKYEELEKKYNQFLNDKVYKKIIKEQASWMNKLTFVASFTINLNLNPFLALEDSPLFVKMYANVNPAVIITNLMHSHELNSKLKGELQQQNYSDLLAIGVSGGCDFKMNNNFAFHATLSLGIKPLSFMYSSTSNAKINSTPESNKLTNFERVLKTKINKPNMTKFETIANKFDVKITLGAKKIFAA